jgi:photosystem II stability/assembly factor-like uncharacterized protein
MKRSRTAGDVGIIVLGIITAALVVTALRTGGTSTADADSLGAINPTPTRSAPAGPRPTAPVSVPPTPSGSASVGGLLPTGEAIALGGSDGALLAMSLGETCTAAPARAIRSADDAATWGKVSLPSQVVRSASVRGLGLVSGYGSGCSSVLLRTFDVGGTWEPLDVTTSLRAVAVGDDERAWALSNTDVMRSTDAGETWAKTSAPCSRTKTKVGPPTLLAAAGERTAWVLCAGTPADGRQARLLLRSTDGGTTWDEMAGARTTAVDDGGRKDGLDGVGELVDLQFLDEKTGYALLRQTECASGQVLRTSDGGSTWTALPCAGGVDALSSLLPTDEGVTALGRKGDQVVLLRGTAQAWSAPAAVSG